MKKLYMLFLAALMCAAALPVVAVQGSYLYSSSRREINAGVLVGDGSIGSCNPALINRTIFFYLEQRYDLKPRGWTFTNPLASGTSTTIDPATGRPKVNFSYWLVDLPNTITENLLKFDVLYLSSQSPMSLSKADSEKLRSFVDGGGLLWVDEGTANMINAAGPLFIEGLQFTTGPWSPGAQIMYRHHPLLTSPYYLNDWELIDLGWRTGTAKSYVQVGKFDTSGIPQESTVLVPIVKNPGITTTDNFNRYASIAGAMYGSGCIVATAGNIGAEITQYPLAFDNTNALKLAFNIVNWTSIWPSFRKTSRRAGGSNEDIGAPMIERWLHAMPPPVSYESGPILYKNIFYYTGNDGTIYALDGFPKEDLDNDGNPDDGIQESGGAHDYDLIWRQAAGGDCSSPTIGEFRVGKDSIDVVFVQGADSKIYAFDAYRLGTPISDASLVSPIYGSSSGRPFAPAFHDGWIYQAGTDGLVHGYNPGGGAAIPPWTSPDPKWGTENPPAKSATVVGTIKNESNGALVDTVIYMGGPEALAYNDRVCFLPVMVRNERLRHRAGDISNTLFDTMFMGRAIATTPPPQAWGRSNLGATVALTADPGSLLGSLTITDGGLPIPNDMVVYANYRLDYPPGNAYSPLKRVFAPSLYTPLKPDSPAPLTVFGSPALGRNGYIYISGKRDESTDPSAPPQVRANPDQVGEVVATQLAFTGGGAAEELRVKWRYPLHGGFSFGGIDYPGVAQDHTLDPPPPVGLPATPGPGVPIRLLQPAGTPALSGDKLFVTAYSGDPTTSPGYSGGALFCFKASPDFILRVHEPLINSTTGGRRNVKIWQPDPLFAPDPNVSPINNSVDVPSKMIDYNRGTITVYDARVVQPRMGPYSASWITPAVAPVIFVDNVQVPANLVDMGQWNNLLWYMTLYHGSWDKPCSGVHSAPSVIGDQVYLQCDDGYIFAVDVETGEATGRQVFCVPPRYESTNRALASHVKWTPSKIGGTGAASGGPGMFSMAGANGLLGVLAKDGLHGYDNPTTLVADNRRLVEMDGGGHTTWTCESVSKWVKNPSGSWSIETQTLNRPAMAKIINSGDYLVADTGNNQVIHVDRAGRVTWGATTFIDPNGLLRPGDPLQLNAPTSAHAWVDTEMIGGASTPVLHHVIADNGNHRIVDLIDGVANVLDANGNPVLDSNGNPIQTPAKILNWVSNTLEQGKEYEFNNVQLWADPSDLTKQTILATVTNYSLFNAPFNTQQPGGSVVLLKYRTIDATGNVTMEKGDIVPGKGYTSIVPPSVGLPVPLTGLRYLLRFYTGISGDPWHDLICMTTGVYEIDSNKGVKVWLTSSEYANMPRDVEPLTVGTTASASSGMVEAPLIATSARILGADRILISNGYSGPTSSNNIFASMEFGGEVFEVSRPVSDVPAMKWYAPRIQVTGPSGTQWKLKEFTENGSNISQPNCVDRIY